MSPARSRVKVKAPVTRAQAVADFSRKKARQRRQQWNRRAFMLTGIGLLVCASLFSGWAIYSGTLQQSVAHIGSGFWQQTAGMGLRIEQITLEGRKHSDAAALKAALGVTKGDPILAVSLAEMKTRLQKIPEIDTVQISRILPNQLAIAITERTPVAWWQKNGVQTLVDAHGVVLSNKTYHEKNTLPIVVGEDAPAHIRELMTLLALVPSMKIDVVAAVRIGQRRWNVQLANGVMVMLPEENPMAAWKRFALLVERDALLSKAIRSVDMRMEDRVFIMPIEQNKSLITLTTARDT